MKLLFLSDLHLGQGDALEDFLEWGGSPEGPPTTTDRNDARSRLDARLARLLEDECTTPPGDDPPHLILLGDVVDLWQTVFGRESPAAALERCFAAHPAVLSALRAWLGGGGRLTWLLGNHDHDLFAKSAWDLVREVLPGINPLSDGAPSRTLSIPEAGLIALHGHQWDPWNAIRSDKPGAGCVGRTVVREVVNPLEPAMPWVDKAADFAALAELLWLQAHDGQLPPALRLALTALDAVLASVCPSLKAMRDLVGRPDPATLRRRLNDRLRKARKALSTDPGAARKMGLAGALPRFVVSGHTHRASDRTVGQTRFLGAGTWRPVIDAMEGQAMRVAQPLDYLVLEGPTPGALEVRFGNARLPAS